MKTRSDPPQVSDLTAKPPANRSRAILAWVGLVALVASAVLASNVFSLRDRLLGSAAAKPAAPATSRVAGGSPAGTAPAAMPGAPAANRGAAAAATSLRSQPWWQDVTALDGNGTATASPFTITDSAIQWRVRWSCGTGRLVVTVPKRSKAVVDGVCPEGNPGYAVQTGAMSLQVTAEGPWHLQIAQQIDAPLVEPPSLAMTAPGASVVATGSFYKVDQTGTGKVSLYRQADRRYSLRLQDFFVSPTTDLELRMSTLPAPHSSQEVMAAQSELVARMDVTAGSLNYTGPATLDPTRYRSVYVWCALTQSAYAAASLVSAK